MTDRHVSRLPGKTKVLIAGVDTLILNAKQKGDDGTPKNRQALPLDVGEHLTMWQKEAKAREEPYVTPWEHETVSLKMWPTGAPGWTWLLKNGLIDLMVGAQLNKGTLARVRFSSEYLWKRGVHTAVTNTHTFLNHLFGETLYLQPAEIHLCADVTGLTIPKDYERVFVSRAKVQRPIKESYLDQPIYRYNKLETVQFSGHASPMSATIYDKPKEIQIRSHKKIWFHDLWKERGWNEDERIWRIECRLKRECLHEMDIEDASDALDKIPALWAYSVGHVGEHDGWLRMVKPNKEDSNRWRWATSDGWVAVQQAFAHGWNGYEDMTDVQRERKREISLSQAEAAIAGYTATYAAWLQDEIESSDDVSVVLTRLYEKMTDLWERKGVDFHYLRRQKQFDYHIS
jgi:hypothetical protein